MISSRNMAVVVLIASLWVSIFGLYLPETQQPPPQWVSFLVLPVIMGVFAAVGSIGETFTKVLLSLAGLALGTVIILVKLGSGTESDGFAYVSLYAVLPIVPFLGSVAGVSLLLNRIRAPSFHKQ